MTNGLKAMAFPVTTDWAFFVLSVKKVFCLGIKKLAIYGFVSAHCTNFQKQLKREKNMNQLKTTGQLRQMLANAAKGVLNGDLDIEKATAIHKLAKNITESLYSETKIAMFQNEVDGTMHKMGELPIGSED